MESSAELLHVAQIVPCTEAEGPGRRFALWFQGCPLRCPGCCNPEMLPFTETSGRTLTSVLAELDAALAENIEGISLLGGEPMAHVPSALALARAAWDRKLTVMVFTGFLLEGLRQRPEREMADLLAHTDILVDGPYQRELPETRRRWIGSRNQRVHFLTGRAAADDPRWLQPNTLEIRLMDGEVTVNGFPAPRAVGLWRRLGARPGGQT